LKLLTGNQARELDLKTIKKGVSAKTLMGSAGHEIAQAVKEITEGRHNQHVAILCGSGNNGGDGFSAAVKLAEWGYRISIYSLKAAHMLNPDADYYHKICLGKKINIIYGFEIPLEFPSFQVVIDALLGIGFKGKLKKEIIPWINWINQQAGKIIAVDIPSGVESDTGRIDTIAVQADSTISMGYLKVGMVLEPGKSNSGKMRAANIGFINGSTALSGRKWTWLKDPAIREILKPLKTKTNKSRQGKVLLISGSTGMTGAASLCAAAVLKSGAGLTVSAAPASLNPIYEIKITEGMTFTCEDGGKGRLSAENFDTILPWIDWCDAIAIGPGLGTAEDTLNLVKLLIEKSDKAIVLDADGLKVLIKHPDLLKNARMPVIITPHYAEFAKISQVPLSTIQKNPLEIIDNYLTHNNCILVLKNSSTCIAWENAGFISTNGNPGLATAGTGDILTGMIAGFLGQGYKPFEAARLGVYFHGLAGDMAAGSLSQRAMVASDLFNQIPKMFKKYE